MKMQKKKQVPTQPGPRARNPRRDRDRSRSRAPTSSPGSGSCGSAARTWLGSSGILCATFTCASAPTRAVRSGALQKSRTMGAYPKHAQKTFERLIRPAELIFSGVRATRGSRRVATGNARQISLTAAARSALCLLYTSDAADDS